MELTQNTVQAPATTNTEGDFGAGASIGWQWK